MLSTGAFDRNPREVDAWFLFLPNYKGNKVQSFEVLKDFSAAVISFLCDAVSTTGNNLFRFWDIVKCNASKLQEFKGIKCFNSFGTSSFFISFLLKVFLHVS